RALAGREPVAVAVDDVQWLDPPSEEVLRFVVRRTRDEALRFVLACRTEDRAPAPLGLDEDGDGVTRLPIGPLSVGATTRLLHGELATTFSRPTLHRLHVASGGNAFFALEIARALVRRDTPHPPP